MKMSPHVDALQNDLASAAALGDDRAAEVGARLAEAATRSAPLRFLEVLGEALLEANEQLPSGHLELRLAGSDPSVVYVEQEGAAAPVDEPSAARLTLRLPERLKSELEAAAAREGVSLNTWLVRALSGAVGHATRPKHPGRRLVGYGRTY
jgi:hypothetical protein